MDLRCLRIPYGLFTLMDTLMFIVDESQVVFLHSVWLSAQ